MFKVSWKKTAIDELANLWTKADSALRQAITAAAHQIDTRLGQDPEDTGESRSGAERIWFVVPLGILFDVNRVERIVRVLQVWEFQKRN